jgi:hypothetical protein
MVYITNLSHKALITLIGMLLEYDGFGGM